MKLIVLVNYTKYTEKEDMAKVMAELDSKINQKLQKDYDLISADYALKRRYLDEKMRQMAKYLQPGTRVLDLGCGNGRFFALVPQGCQYLGLDFSKNLLAIAQHRYPRGRFVYGDMTDEKIWTKLGQSDQIFSFASFHHLMSRQKQLKTLKLCFKHLKKNGLLIIVVWNLWQLKYWLLHLKQLSIHRLLIPYRLSDGHQVIKQINRLYYAFTPRELKKLAQKAGFEIKREFFIDGRTILDAKEFGIIARK